MENKKREEDFRKQLEMAKAAEAAK